MNRWKFHQSPNVAVVSNKKIITNQDAIKCVVHDLTDGGWQFLDGTTQNPDEAVVVSLKNIVDLDASVSELADLPPGWFAWRESKESAWERAENK